MCIQQEKLGVRRTVGTDCPRVRYPEKSRVANYLPVEFQRWRLEFYWIATSNGQEGKVKLYLCLEQQCEKQEGVHNRCYKAVQFKGCR